MAERPAPRFVVGGTVDAASPVYAPRTFEDAIFGKITDGEWVLLLGPRQHGKSSALVRLAERLAASGYSVAFVDLQRYADDEDPYYESFLQWFAGAIAAELASEWVDPSAGARNDLQSWLEAVAPPRYPNIAVLIDEVSGVPARFRERLFGQLRALFNSRARANADAVANRMVFVFAGTFRPEAMIDSDNSPFNISKLELSDWLDRGQVVALARVGLAEAGDTYGNSAFDAVGGQPYLVQRVLAAVQRAADEDRDSAFGTALDEVVNGIDRHIPDLMRLVAADSALMELTKRLVDGDVAFDGSDPTHLFALVSGVAVRVGARLQVSTQLYRRALIALHERAAPAEPSTAPSVVPACDVLLVTATDVETASVRDVFAEGEPFLAGNNVYRALGTYGGAAVVLVRSPEMGGGGQGGAALTVSDAIRFLRPSAVIVVGIAFGMKPKEQDLADVLCATQVVDYELVRLGVDEEGRPSTRQRGSILPASPGLLAGLQDVAVGLTSIKFGQFLSGDKLVDDVDARGALAAVFPDAIGGEMEAFGAASAAERERVEWAVAKAICDFADGHKATDKLSRQRAAAGESAKFVRQVLDAGLLRAPSDDLRTR